MPKVTKSCKYVLFKRSIRGDVFDLLSRHRIICHKLPLTTNSWLARPAMASEDMSFAEVLSKLHVSGAGIPCSASIKSYPSFRRRITRSKCWVAIIPLIVMKVAACLMIDLDGKDWRHTRVAGFSQSVIASRNSCLILVLLRSTDSVERFVRIVGLVLLTKEP